MARELVYTGFMSLDGVVDSRWSPQRSRNNATVPRNLAERSVVWSADTELVAFGVGQCGPVHTELVLVVDVGCTE